MMNFFYKTNSFQELSPKLNFLNASLTSSEKDRLSISNLEAEKRKLPPISQQSFIESRINHLALQFGKLKFDILKDHHVDRKLWKATCFVGGTLGTMLYAWTSNSNSSNISESLTTSDASHPLQKIILNDLPENLNQAFHAAKNDILKNLQESKEDGDVNIQSGKFGIFGIVLIAVVTALTMGILFKKRKNEKGNHQSRNQSIKIDATLIQMPKEILPIPEIDEVSPINKHTLEALQKLILKGQQLPGEVDGTQMIGEEHIAAILYDQLIEQSKRKDCAIILKPAGNGVLPENMTSEMLGLITRYVIIPMAVNNNKHNTVLIVDRKMKTQAYFDSLGDHIHESALDECIQKKIIENNYNNVETDSKCTKQSDVWSCGFHVVENVIAYVNQIEPENKNPQGIDLRKKYKLSFERFANTYGRSEYSIAEGRLYRRQKTRLRDGLEKVGLSIYALYNLWNELKKELNPENPQRDRPLSEFIDSYLLTFSNDFNARTVLVNARDTSSSLYAHLPKTLEETLESTLLQEKEIAEIVKTLLDNTLHAPKISPGDSLSVV